MSEHTISLEIIDGAYAVCRLPSDAAIPDWLSQHTGDEAFQSITRTANELSIVTLNSVVPDDVTAECEWRILKIKGTLDFSLVGILVKVLKPLADCNVGIFAISTYDTDFILIKSKDFAKALEALKGFEIGEE